MNEELVTIEITPKKTLDVFISQPMKGKTASTITKERNDVIDWLNKLYGSKYNINVLESYFPDDYDPTKHNTSYYLGKSIVLLSEANVAVFVEGWEQARGCSIEHTVCEKYGISRIYYINQ